MEGAAAEDVSPIAEFAEAAAKPAAPRAASSPIAVLLGEAAAKPSAPEPASTPIAELADEAEAAPGEAPQVVMPMPNRKLDMLSRRLRQLEIKHYGFISTSRMRE